MFEGHVTPNEDEYQESVQLKFRYCLGVSSKSTVSLLIACIPAEYIDFEIGHFHNLRTTMTLTLDRVIRHAVVYHSSTSTYIQGVYKFN